MKNHIRVVMTRCKGRILGQNVVNNALAHQRRLMFNTDSSAELFYSDEVLENPGRLAIAIELVRRLRAKGLHIDAAGIQGHWGGPLRPCGNSRRPLFNSKQQK